MRRWPKEMLQPRFTPGQKVEYCNSQQELSGFVKGQEVVYAKKGSVGKVVGFHVTATPSWKPLYIVHFGVEDHSFTAGLPSENLKVPK